ncbi:MAG: hypothetical protein CL912_33645 [Deltaproteobacteria bacterium]|nr:hypothetical protein [Deltaproteobacteria bacterium]
MAQSNVNTKENVPLGGAKKGKKGGNAQVDRRFNNVSMFEILADDDGNPKNAKEFNDTPHTEDEVFFIVNDELTGEEREVCDHPHPSSALLAPIPSPSTSICSEPVNNIATRLDIPASRRYTS